MLVGWSAIDKMTVIQDQEAWIPVTALIGVSMDGSQPPYMGSLGALDTLLAHFHSVTMVFNYPLLPLI